MYSWVGHQNKHCSPANDHSVTLIYWRYEIWQIRYVFMYQSYYSLLAKTDLKISYRKPYPHHQPPSLYYRPFFILLYWPPSLSHWCSLAHSKRVMKNIIIFDDNYQMPIPCKHMGQVGALLQQQRSLCEHKHVSEQQQLSTAATTQYTDIQLEVWIFTGVTIRLWFSCQRF